MLKRRDHLGEPREFSRPTGKWASNQYRQTGKDPPIGSLNTSRLMGTDLNLPGKPLGINSPGDMRQDDALTGQK